MLPRTCVQPDRGRVEAEFLEEDLRQLAVVVLARVQDDLLEPSLAQRERDRQPVPADAPRRAGNDPEAGELVSGLEAPRTGLARRPPFAIRREIETQPPTRTL